MRLACASSGSQAGPTGQGELALLTFQALAPGQSSLALSGVLLPGAGRPPVLLASSVTPGQVVVVSAPGAQTATYLPIIVRQ